MTPRKFTLMLHSLCHSRGIAPQEAQVLQITTETKGGRVVFVVQLKVSDDHIEIFNISDNE
jgi:hypothetical protein